MYETGILNEILNCSVTKNLKASQKSSLTNGIAGQLHCINHLGRLKYERKLRELKHHQKENEKVEQELYTMIRKLQDYINARDKMLAVSYDN